MTTEVVNDSRRVLRAITGVVVGSGRLLRAMTDVVIGSGRLLRAFPVWRPSTLRVLRRDGSTLAALLALAARRDPAGTAIVDELGAVSYQELDQQADELARRLPEVRRLGIRHGNDRDFVIAVAAALRIGAEVVPLNPRFTAPELDRITNSEHLDLILPTPLPAPPPHPPPSPVPPPHPQSPPAAPAEPASLAGAWSVVVSAVWKVLAPRGRRGRVVVLTSGSTGAAKGVDRGDVRLAQALPITTLVRRIPLRRGRSMVVTTPLFHGYGLGFLALGLAFGMPVVLRSEAERVAAWLREHPGSLLVGVPAVLARVARAGDGGEVSAVVSGAGLLHPAVAERLQAAYGRVLFNLYGSSEEGWSTLATPDDSAEAPGTIGRPAAGVRVAVLDDSGQPVAAGVVGHLCVSSSLSVGQYTSGERRRRLGGLADSGDLGHRDQGGRLFVDGRADDLVITGGENVFTTEVEDVLLTHPAVADARVDGVPDEEFGARLEALVVRRAAVEADELIAYARARLAPYKLPRAVRFVADLPRTATGKPTRRVT